MMKDWPQKLTYAAILFAAGFIWNANVRLSRLEDNRKHDADQDARIEWLCDRTVTEFNRLNETRAAINPPLYSFPYPERK
jgi:hypothetical protein